MEDGIHVRKKASAAKYTKQCMDLEHCLLHWLHLAPLTHLVVGVHHGDRAPAIGGATGCRRVHCLASSEVERNSSGEDEGSTGGSDGGVDPVAVGQDGSPGAGVGGLGIQVSTCCESMSSMSRV
jgi:hypothetical protein